jgi:branched-chain amino acid transport system substrate-binding protein
MKSKIFITVGVIAAIAIGVFVYLNSAGKKRDIVKIGVILPMTGNGAIYGADLKKGIELAYNNDTTKRIELFYEDDAGDAKMGVNAYNNLKFRGINIVIGGVMSNVANALLPLGNKDKILILSPKGTDPNLSKEDDFFFRIWPTDDVDGKVLTQFIIDSLKTIKKIAIFYPNGDYGVGIQKVFVKNIQNSDIEVVYNEGFQNGQTDFRTQLLKIKQQKPDVLFLPAYFREAVIILKQLNELKNDFYIAGVSSFYEKDIVNASGDLKDKTFFTYPLYSVDSKNPITQIFIDNFKQKYGDTPNAFSAYGYDSFEIIRQAVAILDSDKKDVTSENLKNALESIEIAKGVTGDYTFDKSGDAIKDLQIIWLKNIYNN